MILYSYTKELTLKFLFDSGECKHNCSLRQIQNNVMYVEPRFNTPLWSNAR
jgi:hypothetical protein